MRARLVARVMLLAAAIATAAAAQDIRLQVTANPDPLRAASFPLSPIAAARLAAGEWRLVLAASYANVWQGTWQTAAIHREYARVRQPIGDDELRELERRYPDEEMYRVDLETWRTDIVVQRGLAGGFTLTIQAPWIDVGRPHWDAVAEWWHSHLGLPNADRDLFPRGDTFLWVRGRGMTVEHRGELARSGFGDASASLGVPLGSAAGGEHRLVVGVEAPTGARDSLLGSGGWDVAARYFGLWHWRTRSLVLAAGYTRLDPHGSLLGVERADLWHGYAGIEQRLGASWRAAASFSYESSPLADLTSSALGRPAAFLQLGFSRDLGARSWIAFDLGQDWYNVGVSPDYAFRLTFGTASAPSAR